MKKSIHFYKYGGPEVFEVVKVPELSPKPNEIVVQIKATAANSGDARVRSVDAPGMIVKIIFRLMMGWNAPRQKVLGNVFAGKIKSVGENVTKFQPGDRVFGSLGMSSGTYAEELIVTESSVMTFIPNNASYEEATALPFGGLSALHFLNKVTIQPNTNVLVYGAAGSVGSMAVQILRIYGANITAVCRERHHEFIKSLGVTNVLDYTKDEFLNHDDKYDVVFDAVGYLDKKKRNQMLLPKGKYLSVSSLEIANDTNENLQKLADWLESGQLKAIIDRTYALEDMVSAHEYLDTKQKRGNIVITVDE